MNNGNSDNQVKIVQNFYTVMFRNYYLTLCLEQLNNELYKLDREPIDDYKYIEWESCIDDFKYIEWENFNDNFKKFQELYKLCRQTGRCQIDIYEANIQELKTVNYLISFSNNDEWLFVFRNDGKLLTAGSKFYEIIVWAETSLIQQYSNADDLLTSYCGCGFPGFLEARQQRLM